MNGNKIRVMHIAECIGGVGRYLHSLLKYMDHDRFENILILSQLYKSENYIYLADKVEILYMTHSMGLKTIFKVKDIRKFIKKYDPDIIYAHSSIAGAIARLAGIGMRSKCIYNPHGWSFNMHDKKQRLFVVLEKIMSPFCDAIVCISDAEKKSALDKKICCKDKLHVIYNGIDFDEYQNRDIHRKTLGIPKDAFVVGMTGRICRQKAPDIFVRMAGEIRKVIDNAYFIIVGNVLEGAEKERTEIENLARYLNVKLYITGWVNNPLDYVNTFNVACLFSRWEGFGLAIPEYMLCGKPIVATRVDAIPYLITNRINGILVEANDYKTAAEVVLEINSNMELRDKLIENGYKTVHERFDAKRMAKEIENLIYGMVIKL